MVCNNFFDLVKYKLILILICLNSSYISSQKLISSKLEIYDIYNEKRKVVLEEKLTRKDVPSWDSFVKNKGYKTTSVMYYADERGSPVGLLRDKKIQLINDIIERENNSL